MIKSIKNFQNNIAKDKLFWLPVLLFTLLAYGFSMTRNTVSIDDMSLDYYGGVHGAIAASGRWGMEIWHKLIGIGGFSVYIYKFLGVLFLVAAAYILCAIFYNLKPSYTDKVYPFTFFASVFITFPLINEIWEYGGANMIIAGNLFVVFFITMYILFSEHKNWVKYVVGGVVLSVVVSSYESAIFVMITAVISILFYKYCILKEKDKPYSWILDGLKFVPSIIIAVILRFVVAFLWLKIFNLKPVKLGSTEIGWKHFSFGKLITIIKDLIRTYITKYYYLPVLLFAIALCALLIYIVFRSIKNRSILPVLIGGLLVCSIFLLPFVQFKGMVYRTAQTINYTTAFTVFILMLAASKVNIKWFSTVVVVVMTLATVYQSVYLAELLEWNNLRSDNEIAVVNYLGTQLTTKYKNSDKEIVFCGRYQASEYLKSKIFRGDKKITDTNHKSVLTWSTAAFPGKKVNVMKKLFSYCGYDLNIVHKYSKNKIIELARYARKIGMNPLEIRDVGDYILVYLG